MIINFRAVIVNSLEVRNSLRYNKTNGVKAYMKFVLMTNQKFQAARVYFKDIKLKLEERGEFADFIVGKGDLDKRKDYLSQVDIIFATWGMPHLSKEEIKKYFPQLKAVLYAAGTVQRFAGEFLELGIKVSSAWRANAIPVAEFTFAQIILAQKGYFQAAATVKKNEAAAYLHHYRQPGNYKTKIGIIGAGAIGSLVCEKLKTLECEVFVYDPFLSEDRAKELKVTLCDLDTIFSSCDVISNHLANKKELIGIFNYSLFSKMKPYATFINTGRGDQVVEKDLARAMREKSSRTALLDVTKTDIITYANPMTRQKNIIQTPHIAGSSGQEVWRMAEYMIEEYDRLVAGKPLLHEVTLDMLSTMA
jgi:phosphoglycerate dehydrogenase-like enzyme